MKGLNLIPKTENWLGSSVLCTGKLLFGSSDMRRGWRHYVRSTLRFSGGPGRSALVPRSRWAHEGSLRRRKIIRWWEIRGKVHADTDTPHNKYRLISSHSRSAFPDFKIQPPSLTTWERTSVVLVCVASLPLVTEASPTLSGATLTRLSLCPSE